MSDDEKCMILYSSCDSFAMDRDQHHTAEGGQWEPVTDITMCSAAAQSDEEQNETEAEISFQVNNDNPETADLSG